MDEIGICKNVCGDWIVGGFMIVMIKACMISIIAMIPKA